MRIITIILMVFIVSFFIGTMSSVNRSFGQDPCITPSPTVETYTTFIMAVDRNIRSCPNLTCKIVGVATTNQIVAFHNFQTDRFGYTWGQFYDGTWVSIALKTTNYAIPLK